MIIEQTKPVVLEPGWYQAVVADVQAVSGQYGDQLEFTFLLSLPGGQRRIRAWATPKFSPGTKLYAWCEAIFGRAIPSSYNLDTAHLVNRAVDVRLERKSGPRGEYVKVAALSKAGSMTRADSQGDVPFA